MVLEAAHRANDEQTAILAKHRAVLAAGAEAPSPFVMAHAADSAEFSTEASSECLQLIPTEPESHWAVPWARCHGYLSGSRGPCLHGRYLLWTR